MINIGDTVPEFTLPGTGGDEINKYQLADFIDSGVAVLVFYPFDFSPVCTKELCMFRDAEWLAFTGDVDVVGISLDSAYAHKRFIQDHSLTFPLLSDTKGRITESYGLAYDEWEHHVGVPKRALITIDDSNVVQYTWKTEDAYENPSLDELRESIKSLT